MSKHNLYENVLFLVGKEEKKNLFYILFLSIISVILDLFGISLVIPLLALISSDGIDSFFLIAPFTKQFFYSFSKEEIFVYTAILIICYFCFKALFNFYFTWTERSFLQNLRVKISNKLYMKYLNKNLIFLMDFNTSKILRNIEQETHLICTSYINSSLKLFLEILLTISFSIMMFYFNFLESVIVFSIMLCISLLHLFAVKKTLSRYGFERISNSQKIIENINESFSLIKEIQIFNKINEVVKKFSFLQKRNAKIAIYEEVANFLPSIYFEFLAVASICIVLMVSVIQGNNISETISSAGLFAVIAVKLMPSLKRLINNISNLIHHIPSVENILQDLKSDNNNFEREENHPEVKNFFENEIEVNSSLKINNLSFYYIDQKNNYKKDIFSDSSINLKFNSINGIVGESGTGKTTFINILSGLFKAQTGSFFLNQINLKSLSQLTPYIGYVSQNINLSDNSIMNNITFETDKKKIDYKKINYLLEVLNLKKIIDSLPEGIDTNLGEQGMKFSGGQRQRIAIARSLYLEKKILVFDEATSSLDPENEKNFFEIIKKIKYGKIIVFISHKKTLFDFCENVYEISNCKFNKL